MSPAVVEFLPQPLERFRSTLRGICGSFDLHPLDARRDIVEGHVSVANLSGLDVARVGLDVDHVTRDAHDIRRDPGDHFFLILQHKGRAQLIQGDVATWVEPGDMFVVDSTQESRFIYGGEASLQVSVHLPRNEMCQRFGQRIYGGLAIEGHDPMAVAMKALLAKLTTTPDVGGQPHTVEAFYSVFGALLTDRSQGSGGQANPDRKLVQRSLTHIAEHYRSPDFTSQSLADLLGVSLRRLQRAFRITDETAHERLQRFRVEAVHTALQAPSRNGEAATVTSLAFNAGFRDLSTFYRAYRKRFGAKPGQTRL
ncbi:MAG: helix-turn-helix domain-containing protein [Pseudomonadota bacterium]